jgi:hypothetical protein
MAPAVLTGLKSESVVPMIFSSVGRFMG